MRSGEGLGAGARKCVGQVIRQRGVRCASRMTFHTNISNEVSWLPFRVCRQRLTIIRLALHCPVQRAVRRGGARLIRRAGLVRTVPFEPLSLWFVAKASDNRERVRGGDRVAKASPDYCASRRRTVGASIRRTEERRLGVQKSAPPANRWRKAGRQRLRVPIGPGRGGIKR